MDVTNGITNFVYPLSQPVVVEVIKINNNNKNTWKNSTSNFQENCKTVSLNTLDIVNISYISIFSWIQIHKYTQFETVVYFYVQRINIVNNDHYSVFKKNILNINVS